MITPFIMTNVKPDKNKNRRKAIFPKREGLYTLVLENVAQKLVIINTYQQFAICFNNND